MTRMTGDLADYLRWIADGQKAYSGDILREAANRLIDLAIENHNLKTTIERLHMSTNDVPGANPRNGDELRMGCWAEHADGSLIFVEGTEDQRVVYSIFDMSQVPPVEYRDTMSIGGFKTAFSWNPKDSKSEKWTWHDKSPFPWDKIIKNGAKDGVRLPHADEYENAAQRVRKSREIHQGRPVDEDVIDTMIDKLGVVAKHVVRRLQRKISELDK